MGFPPYVEADARAECHRLLDLLPEVEIAALLMQLSDAVDFWQQSAPTKPATDERP